MEKVLVIGCGLIGGSVAYGAVDAGYAVSVWDTDAAVRTQIGEHFPLLDPTAAEEISGIVVIATPPSAVAGWAKTLLARYPQLTVTDTASVKLPLVEELLPELDLHQSARWVPGHPLAGRAGGGFNNASAELFRGAPWVLCDDHDIDMQVLADVSRLIERLGAREMRVDAERHDARLATTSHLATLVASALMGTVGDDADMLRSSGTGLRDVTRLAGLEPKLWTEILLANSIAVLEATDRMQASLQQAHDLVAAGDAVGLETWLAANRDLRSKLEALRWSPEPPIT